MDASPHRSTGRRALLPLLRALSDAACEGGRHFLDGLGASVSSDAFRARPGKIAPGGPPARRCPQGRAGVVREALLHHRLDRDRLDRRVTASQHSLSDLRFLRQSRSCSACRIRTLFGARSRSAVRGGWSRGLGGLFRYRPTVGVGMLGQLPVMSVPSGFASNGVPTGVQIVARSWDDLAVFRAAATIEQLRPWASHRPHLPTT